MKKYFFVLPLTLSCGILLAQSKPVPPLTHQVRYLTSEEAGLNTEAAQAGKPLVLNEFTIMGTNVAGVPCYNCVTAVDAPNLGVVTPIGLVSTNVSYGLEAYVLDQNYTGTCTYTFNVTRQSTVIYTASYEFSETAPASVLLGTAITIPSGTPKGAASLSMTAVCGSSTTKSGSAIYITN